ncbi:unnamed protein product [Prorocentrum cordatum]|uniref:Ubiquitin-like domain-containing protein n=1 Tax=Prorocentrum cordatum TaxID=2364126 RepID=A0ABN9VY38_9DINO|nr:unnamed protein product [Polarella glacialis]
MAPLCYRPLPLLLALAPLAAGRGALHARLASEPVAPPAAEPTREELIALGIWPPPEPVGPAPTKKDGSYGSKADACQACKNMATGSCAMYRTCLCYAANAVFETPGIPAPTDRTNYHWTCGNEGGDKYELCFKSDPKYTDSFGDEFDVNKPKCPVSQWWAKERKRLQQRRADFRPSGPQHFRAMEDVGADDPAAEETFQVFVKTLVGQTITLNVAASDAVHYIKGLIQDSEGAPAHQQRVIFETKQLDDKRKIGDYSVRNGSTLHLSERLRGGGKKGEVVPSLAAAADVPAADEVILQGHLRGGMPPARATSMEEYPMPGDLGPENHPRMPLGSCCAKPFANYGVLAKHLKRAEPLGQNCRARGSTPGARWSAGR